MAKKQSVKTLPQKKRASKKSKATPSKQAKQIAANKRIKRGASGEITSIKNLPKGKRPSGKQITKAVKAKSIKVKPTIIGRRFGRFEIDLGVHKIDDVAGVIKGFRQKHRANFGSIIKDEAGNVIARTHIAKGFRSTLPEQLAVKALSKYARRMDEVRIVLSIQQPKQAEKKPKEKVSETEYAVVGYDAKGKPIRKKIEVVY